MKSPAILTLMFAVVLACGCGGKSSVYSGPLGEVSGVVTVAGKPVTEGVAVSFLASGDVSFVATGQTNDKGEFSLRWNGQKGIPVGSYKVSLTQPPLFTETDPDKLMEMSQKGLLPKPTAQIPPKYNNPGTSGLLMTIVEGGQTFTLEAD